MKIEDYKNALNRMHMKSELKTEIIDSSVEKNKKNIRESVIVPIASVSAIVLSAFIVVFAISGIFRKTIDYETKNTIEKSIYEVIFNVEKILNEVISDEAASINILKAIPREMDVFTIKDIFNKNDANDDRSLLYYGDGDICWQYDDNYDYSYSKAVFAFDYNNDYGEAYNGVAPGQNR